jgi:CDP-glucose 4,6-dehydratase
LLVLDVSDIEKKVGIVPRWSLEVTVTKTMTWYRDFIAGASAKKLCEADIASYFKA